MVVALEPVPKTTGKNRKGNTFVKTVTKDLVRTFECIKQGSFKPVTGTEKVITTKAGTTTSTTSLIDYGTGACDNTCTVTTSGKTETRTDDTKTGSGAGTQVDVSNEVVNAFRNDDKEKSYFDDPYDLFEIARNQARAFAPKGQGTPLLTLKQFPHYKCATLTLKNSVTNKSDGSIDGDTLTVDFGNALCKDAFGDTRNGVIEMIHVGPSSDLVYDVYTITLKNFKKNGVSYTGSWEIKLTGGATTTMIVNHTGGSITLANKTATRSYSYTIVLAPSGTGTTITVKAGSKSEGVNLNGKGFSRMVKTDIVDNQGSCSPQISGGVPQSGSEELLVYSSAERTIANLAATIGVNYGTGTCDSKATLSYNGSSKEVDLISQ